MKYEFGTAEKIRAGGRRNPSWNDDTETLLWPIVPVSCLTGEMPKTAEDQFKFCLNEMESWFDHPGLAIIGIYKSQVISCNCYLENLDDWNSFKELWEDFWEDIEPDTYINQASFLGDRGKVEIEMEIKGVPKR